ncbi:MAG: hydroxyacylglutathione hydrolase [Pseudoalteromonas tetraodonis]|jgi:hydroxyacylglutathione hydrolase
MLNIRRFTGGFAATNGFLIEAPQGLVLVDAPEAVSEWLEGQGIEVTDLLLTHVHFDHVLDAAKVRDRGVRVYSYAALSKELSLEVMFGEIFGGAFAVVPFATDELLEGIGKIEVAGLELEILHVPGHSPDSICFYSREHAQLFGGDVLMQAGYGRTDFPHGDEAQLFAGIEEKLFSLDDEVVVYPGHGNDTSIGAERVRGLIG